MNDTRSNCDFMTFYEWHFLDLIMNFMTDNYDLYDLFMNETVI